ncbi:MAG TPA: hypothetical protein VFP35_03890 [Candidatus Saccharimonadales bacterium]|nr:hypothetical protein [Candidatus Saccharimonadales bacterium]
MTERRTSRAERPTIEPLEGDHLGAVASLLQKAADIRRSHFTRPVTTFTSKDGEKLVASIDQAEITIEDSANVKVWLKSHEREIAMTIGGILLAAGMITLQKNRTQRKKMSKRAGSYIKPGQR